MFSTFLRHATQFVLYPTNMPSILLLSFFGSNTICFFQTE